MYFKNRPSINPMWPPSSFLREAQKLQRVNFSNFAIFLNTNSACKFFFELDSIHMCILVSKSGKKEQFIQQTSLDILFFPSKFESYQGRPKRPIELNDYFGSAPTAHLKKCVMFSRSTYIAIKYQTSKYSHKMVSGTILLLVTYNHIQRFQTLHR